MEVSLKYIEPECDGKEDQVQFCLQTNFSILWPPPRPTTPTTINQPKLPFLWSKDNFINCQWEDMFKCNRIPIDRAACHYLWWMKQITLWKKSKILPRESFTHGIAGYASFEFASLTVSKLGVFCSFLHFPSFETGQVLLLHRRESRVIEKRRALN